MYKNNGDFSTCSTHAAYYRNHMAQVLVSNLSRGDQHVAFRQSKPYRLTTQKSGILPNTLR